MKAENPAYLSSGEKKRLIIAAILASESDIICIDESLTMLDSLGKERLFKKIRKLQQEQRKTVIFMGPETEELLKTDRIILMKNGQIEKQGLPREILKQSAMLSSYNIRPLPLAETFQNEKDPPLTVEEGWKLIAEKK